MIRSIIVAMTPSGIIGHKNQMPWHLPEDLKRFRKLTTGHPVIMGRKTFESIGKPLPQRHNIVISRNLDYNPPDVDVAHTVLGGLIIADQLGAKEVFIIGGREVYNQALPCCDKLYLTLLGEEFEGDTQFMFDVGDWTIIDREYVDGKIPHQNITLIKRKEEMTGWLTFERLPNNTLPLPRYATPLAAGIDISACLTRPCKKVDGTTKTEFWVIENERVPVVPDSPPLPEPKTRKLSILPNETIMIPLGYKTSFGPSFCLKIYVRSSVGLRGLVLANGTGIVDPDYRGELFAAVRNTSTYTIDIEHGERIVQGILTPFAQAIVKEEKVDTTERGEGGFGSTGTK